MASRSPDKVEETRIPIGIVLLVVGAIILGTASILWVASSARTVPDLKPLSALSNNAAPILSQAIIVTPTPDIGANTATGPVLLPQSPLEEQELPSFAAASEAPTHYQVNIAHQPERLVIPALGIDVPVRPVGLTALEEDGQNYFQWQVPAGYEVGWHKTSAPLGQVGNTVLNGHNNIHGEVFRYLIDLEIGSEIILHDDGRSYHYAVSQVELVPENDQPLSVRLENARLIENTQDERVTLISCWPYLTNAQRIVVIARPLEQNSF